MTSLGKQVQDLLEEVAESVLDSSPEELRQELIDQGLDPDQVATESRDKLLATLRQSFVGLTD